MHKESEVDWLVAGSGALVYAMALLQGRMVVYAVINLAVAVGWCVWRLLEKFFTDFAYFRHYC